MPNSLFKKYVGAILIATAGALFWTMVMPVYNSYAQLKTAVSEREQILEKRRAIIEKIRTLQIESREKSADINKFSSIIPAKKSAAELVSSIDALAAQNGLQLIGMNITEQKSAQSDSAYGIVGLDLSLIGSYPSLLSFLASAEKNSRLIDIQTVDASEISSGAGINFKIKANTYFLK